LALACELGNIRLFRNDHGNFIDVTTEWGLAKYIGFWNGVTAGDFDGDGRMDLAASNLGENSRYQRFVGKDLRIYYGDFDGNGFVEIIEAYRENGRLLPIQPFFTMASAMPWLREKVTSFSAYAEASLDDIYGEHLKRAKEIPITCLQSTVFLNRGDHFEAVPLPAEAQFAPAYALCVADFDGDGNEDLFLSQNLFAVHPDTSRYDAGRGL